MEHGSMITVISALVIAASATSASSAAAAAPGAVPDPMPPAAWAQQDPADSLWRAARQALDRGDHAAAAAAYRRIRTESRFSASAYRTHAVYWEAFSRHRIGTLAELRASRELLDDLARRHPNFENIAEVRRLQARVDGELANRGDARSASRAAVSAASAAPTPPPTPPARATPAPAPAPAPMAPGRSALTTPPGCPDNELRAAAVESLISMPAEQALPILEQVMARKDECNAKLRETAVFLISQKRGARAEDLLLDAARTDPNATVRQQAVFWLSRVNSDKAVDAIQEILSTSMEPKMIEQAIFALSQHPSPRATQLLRDIASRQGPFVEARKHAIFWLGRRSDGASAEFLRGLYSSAADAATKEAIIFAVAQRANENSTDWLLDIAMNEREGAETRKQALFWAGRQGALPLNRLADLYNRMPTREMKEQVIFTLSQRREPEALDRMIEIARTEQNRQLRQTLLFWIGRSNDPRAARFLADIIGS
jgi:TolA-binding protein